MTEGVEAEGGDGPGRTGRPGPGAPGAPSDGDAATDGSSRRSRRATVVALVKRMVDAIRDGDDASVEQSILKLSERSRWLAPLALVVGAFVMLFQGVRLLVTNWRLTLVQILPAMWIWAAMLDIKLHVFRGKEFHIIRGPLLIPAILGVAVITAASFFLNAVFAFAIAKPGKPEIRPAFTQARAHLRAIVPYGLVIGVALGVAALVVSRFGLFWYAFALSVVVAVMMVAYVSVPARLVGVKPNISRRDKLSAAAVGGAIGATVCSPPYALGRLAILMLGIHYLRFPAIILLVIAVILQTGATTATKAVKFSAKLVANPNSATRRAASEATASANGAGAGPVPVVDPVASAAGEPG